MCLILMTMACSKKKGPGDDGPGTIKPPEGVPIQTARGATTGAAITASIGATGGTFSSADGKITIIVPAGAVTAATNFSIQPVANTLRPGDDAFLPAFRVLPENVTFAKPISVKMKYDPTKLTTGAESSARMAYQTADGRWKSARATLDMTAKTLTAQVTHFCDFCFYDQFQLFCNKAALNKGEMAKLSVGMIAVKDETDDLLSPEAGDVLEQVYGQSGKYYRDISALQVLPVKDWKIVQGGGKIVPKSNVWLVEGNAEYTAPDNITQVQTAIIEVKLEGQRPIPDPGAPGGSRPLGTLIMRKEIKLMPEGFITLRYDGADHAFTQSLIAQVQHGLTGIGGNFNNGEMGIAINIGTTDAGAYSCENPQANNGKAQITWAYRKGNNPVFASSTYCVEEGGSGVPKYSGGTVKLTYIGVLGDFVEGEFNGTLYEANPNSQTCEFEHKQVAIRFRVKRTL